MDESLNHIPKFDKDTVDKLQSIVQRAKQRKPKNQNQTQTRKNRNIVQEVQSDLKKNSPEYNKKLDWLDTLDRYLKDQYHEAAVFKIEAASNTTTRKKPRVFKLAQSMISSETTPAPAPAPAPAKEKKSRVFKLAKSTADAMTKAEAAPAPAPTPAPASQSKEEPPKSFPTLYGKSTTGKTQVWSIEVIPKGKEKTSPATVRVTYGYEDGAKVTNEKEITKGKNLGRKNETTPYEQALSEAQSTWEKKKDGGYAETLNAVIAPALASENAVAAHKTLLPMLAHDFNKRGKDIQFPCYVQAKLDGVRSIFHKGSFTSRQGKPFGFLDHIVAELGPATKADLILDGEIYSTTLSFQDFVGLVKKKKLTEKDKQDLKHVHLWVYDIVNDDPFEKRLATMKDFFSKHKFTYVHLLPTEECKTRADLKTFHDKYVKEGNEGLILRNKNGLYKLNARSADLQKYKEFEDDEFEVIGFTEGEGLEKGLVIWICTTKDGKVFNVRPRGTHEERAELFKKAKNYIGKKLTVRFQELSDDGIPRFPVGITFRDYE
jgi:DNA ligase-1